MYVTCLGTNVYTFTATYTIGAHMSVNMYWKGERLCVRMYDMKERVRPLDRDIYSVCTYFATLCP